MVNVGQYLARGIVSIESSISIRTLAHEFAKNQRSTSKELEVLEEFAAELERAFCIGEYRR